MCGQVMTLEKSLNLVPKLRLVISDPSAVSLEEKLSLFSASVDGGLNPKLETFIRLVMRNERESYLRLIFHDFAVNYLKSRKILMGKLVTAVDSPSLADTLAGIVREKTGYEVRIEKVVDPGIIGGFVFIVDDFKLDAGVAGQIAGLRRGLLKKRA